MTVRREGGRGIWSFQRFLQSFMSSWSITLPPPSGFLIPGAMASAYDQDAWIEKLKEMIRWVGREGGRDERRKERGREMEEAYGSRDVDRSKMIIIV